MPTCRTHGSELVGGQCGFCKLKTAAAKAKTPRDLMQEKLREAEAAAFAYFQSCEIGDERGKAYDIYENVRLAGRVY